MNEQEKFIINWCGNHCGFDALDTEFHEEFHKLFGGKRHECYFGAQTVYKAMRLAKSMFNQGKLKRGKISLGGNWQVGFPKWVWTYSLPPNL